MSTIYDLLYLSVSFGSQTPSEPHIKPLWQVAWRVVNLQDVAPTESLDEPWKTKGWNAQRWRFGSDDFPLNNSVIVTFHVNSPGCIVISMGGKFLDLIPRASEQSTWCLQYSLSIAPGSPKNHKTLALHFFQNKFNRFALLHPKLNGVCWKSLLTLPGLQTATNTSRY